MGGLGAYSASSDSVIKLGVDVRWYKNVYCMAQKLVQYHHDGLNPHVMFIRREHADFVKARIDDDAGKTDREPVGVIIKLSRCTDDNVKFYTYEVWDFERWNYWRCREQLKLLICFCDQANSIISYSGYELPDEEIKLITSYKSLPVIAVNTIHQVAWYPEDYASLRFKVDKEADDWILVEKEYLNSKLQSLIVD
ncbi:hypothetical protein R6242_22190 [Iodobacter sp. CM08]|uniref:hypothetical protein n=1 Tax=Iodobacter sp. CM08 TaxID=3085902 RepID=UPI0029814550|nr:hypothetical protein [Iodobacter sp. CM08]MDW5419286.1 hypothetical protein [Iodobacter sp. CM08]